MNEAEARAICQRFALEHKIVFDDEGECGFGRECVGLKHGDRWIDHNPIVRTGHNEWASLPEKECYAAYPPPESPNHYHKHQCLAILGRGAERIVELAEWVLSMERQGKVSIEEFHTGADVLQALFSGLTGMAVMIR